MPGCEVGHFYYISDMEASKTVEWIDGIITDLVRPEISLENCLRKTLVLAFQIDNDKLKTWVESELNGYNDVEVPSYRKVSAELRGRLTQATYGGILTRNHERLPVELSDNDFVKKFLKAYNIKHSIASLEEIVKKDDSRSVLAIPAPIHTISLFEEIIPDWNIEQIWINIGYLSVISVISSIKNNLLNFLLELNREISQNANFSIMNKQEKVNEILGHTIGVVHAENAVFGGSNYQSKGDNNTVAQGKQVTQTVLSSSELKQKADELSSLIKEHLDQINELSLDDKADISHEVQSIEAQVMRTEPKYPIVRKSLQVIESLLINVASNAYTPIILQKIHELSTFLP